MSKQPILLDKNMVAVSKTPGPRTEPATASPDKTVKQSKDYGVPLNFRVPEEFNERFRIAAVRRKLKLHELLQRAFEVYMREEGEP